MILLIDGLNLFCTAFSAFPNVSTTGQHMGGTVGFLKMLSKIINETHPTRIAVAWESGGSRRRRNLDGGYKMTRKPQKLNRFYEDDIPETKENRDWQLSHLIRMLRCVPIMQVYVEDCEGDDIIARLAFNFRDEEKIIASSDMDYYQLIDEKTRVYNIKKKSFVTDAEVYERFRVHSKNFAVLKAMCGDTSDNVQGVRGLGYKTFTKLFPIVTTDNECSLNEIKLYSMSHSDDSALYKRVIDEWNKVELNLRLVKLDGSMLTHSQIKKIDDSIELYDGAFNKLEFIKLLVSLGAGVFEADSFFQSLAGIKGGKWEQLA
jgi:DNA polymerase-1